MNKKSSIRIKLPVLLVNTMQKRVDQHQHHGDQHKNNSNKKCARRISFVIINPFSTNKSPEKSSSSKSSEASENGSKERTSKVRLPLLGLLTGKKSLKKLMRCETDTTGVHGFEKQESSSPLARVLPQPMLNSCKKLRVAMSYMKARKMKSIEKLEEDSKQEDKSSEYELCKKRILMGGKCNSGTLHYDQNCILLSDVHP